MASFLSRYIFAWGHLGFDAKTMRKIVALRKMDKGARQEAEALLETYKAALGLAD